MAFTIKELTDDMLTIVIDGVVLNSISQCKSTRTVYIFDEFVVKFDFQGFDGQNALELDMWERLEDDDRQYFASLLDWAEFDEFGLVLCQERIKTNGNYLPTEKMVDVFARLYAIYDLGDVDVQLYDLSNCTIDTNGQLKIYDYAL